MPSLADKRADRDDSLRVLPGLLRPAIDAEAAQPAAAGLWRHDSSVWSNDPATPKKIADQLGWLSSPRLVGKSIPRLRPFAERVKRDAITDVVVPGMGGSSAAPRGDYVITVSHLTAPSAALLHTLADALLARLR